MKNLKTIIGTLVLTVFLFGCQTNEENVELEVLNESNNTNRRANENHNLEFTSILIQFHDDVSESYKQQVRGEFAYFFTFFNIQSCHINKERWIIEEISASDYLEALISLAYNDITTTLNGGNQDDVTDPNSNVQFFDIKYNVDCSYIFPRPRP